MTGTFDHEFKETVSDSVDCRIWAHLAEDLASLFGESSAQVFPAWNGRGNNQERQESNSSVELFLEVPEKKALETRVEHGPRHLLRRPLPFSVPIPGQVLQNARYQAGTAMATLPQQKLM